MKEHRKSKRMMVHTKEQRRAIASPFRLELIGLFISNEPLSVAQMAKRMGRTATSLHYHVNVLESAGILRRVGTQRVGKRSEVLYLPVAELFLVKNESDGVAAAEALSRLFRMAESDMRAALHGPQSKSEGPYRNVYGVRMHSRISKKHLAELNRHLRAIEKMLSQAHRKHKPSSDDQFISLTLALMPLRNREISS